MVIDQCNSRQCTQFILPTFDNWREWLILLQSTRMVDSDICIDKIGWFYPNRESTFWTMHAILELHIPILAMRNNKMGHRINKMWTLINKVGHRNVKLVDTYQQVGFKKQQNGSRVLYHDSNSLLFSCDTGQKWYLCASILPRTIRNLLRHKEGVIVAAIIFNIFFHLIKNSKESERTKRWCFCYDTYRAPPR